MAKKINELTMQRIKERVAPADDFYISSDRIVTLDAQPIRKAGLPIGEPYRIEGGRVMLFTEGEIIIDVNLETFNVKSGSLLIIPEQAIFQFEKVSADINFLSFSFANLRTTHKFNHPHVLALSTQEADRYKTYIRLLWQCAKENNDEINPEYDRLAEAALEYAIRLSKNANVKAESSEHDSRGKQLFEQFIDLLNTREGREHKPEYFASQLFVSVGYLSKVIRQQSGQTIVQWINRSVILQAKILLRHSDMPVYEIAERLNFPNPSFFNKFFKKLTGMTPMKYRKS